MLHQENICGKLSEVMKMWLVQIFFYGMMLAWLCFVKQGEADDAEQWQDSVVRHDSLLRVLF